MSSSKRVTISSYNDTTITFSYKGETFVIPKDLFDGDLKIGATVHLQLLDDQIKTKEQKNLAKNILNSLFGHHE